MLSNKNILVTGVGKGIGFNLLHKIISYNGYVYGITRSKADLKKLLPHHKFYLDIYSR